MNEKLTAEEVGVIKEYEMGSDVGDEVVCFICGQLASRNLMVIQQARQRGMIIFARSTRTGMKAVRDWEKRKS